MANTETDHNRPDEEAKSGGLNVRVVLHAVRRHPFMLVLAALLGGAAAVGVWNYLPLPKTTVAVVFRIAGPDAGESQSQLYKQNLATLVKSRAFLSTTLGQKEVKALSVVPNIPLEDQVTWLERNLKVDFKPGPAFMRITMEGDQVKDLQILLAVLADEYLKLLNKEADQTRLNKMDENKKSLAKINKELEDLDYKDTIAAKSIGEPNAAAVLARFEKLKSQYDAADKDLTSLRNLKEEAEHNLAFATWSPDTAQVAAIGGVGASIPPWCVVDPWAVQARLANNGDLQKLADEVKKASDALAAIKKSYTDPNSDAAKAKIRTHEQGLANAKENLNKQLPDAQAAAEKALRNEQLTKYLAQVEKSTFEIREHERHIGIVSRRISGLKGQLDSLTSYRSDIEKNNAARNIKQQNANRLNAVLEQLNLEIGTQSHVQVSDEPFAIAGLEGNRRMKFALGASVAVFLAGFAGVVFWEYRGRRVTHADEIANEVGERVIGTIPPLVADGVQTSHAHLVEAIDTARTMLMHGTPEGTKIRTLLVTSAVSGEGKTTLAGHLAISLTRAGFRTLLVDGDLHAPSVHTLFDLPGTPGLSELLRGEVEFSTAIRTSPVPGLSILPAGKWTLATRQMLVGDRWRKLKGELEAQFDFVVIDTAPLLLVSDTLLLAREADAVVLSVLLGTSQITCITQTVKRLRTIGANVSGAVVNNVKSENYGQGYWTVPKYPADSADESELPFADNATREG